MRHAMWRVREYQRRLQGFDGDVDLEEAALAPLTLVEAEVGANVFGGPDEGGHAERDLEDERHPCGGSQASEEPDEEPPVADVPPPLEAAEPNQTVRLHRANDSFYEDYLHRGSTEHVAKGTEARTPLADMSFYDYGMFVEVVQGDPWALRADQYAFDEHHVKFLTHVQQLRPHPAVPYIHGFTMPTATKDAGTNACFKLALLRPHRCPGRGQCSNLKAYDGFCDSKIVRRRKRDTHGIPEVDDGGRPTFEAVESYSFVGPWRRYEAEQVSKALAADLKIHAQRKYPVLQDGHIGLVHGMGHLCQFYSKHRNYISDILKCALGLDLPRRCLKHC